MNNQHRPSAKYGEVNADAQLHVRLPASLKNIFVIKANQEGLKLSELVIKALNEFIEKDKAK